jgi:signal transduction histidine kinase
MGPAHSPSVTARAVESDQRTTGRILVVEDEHLVALDLQQVLTRQGHDVVVAYYGEDAITIATTQHLDLVLMDIRLGGTVDGIDAANEISSSSDVPIIYLTAYADDATLERARKSEPYGYILKPFQERELVATIEMVLERYRSERRRWEDQMLHRFLAEAGQRMAATLDYRVVARGAAELLVPRYADWCELHLTPVDELSPQLSLWRPNGDHVRETNVPRLLDIVQRTARTELITDLPNDEAVRDALGSDHLGTLHELGARSAVCVPVIARDQVLGALVMVTGRNRARYRADDAVFAEDFGRRLGIALDNALLYRRAEHATRMRDDVLAIVSHDLRTPLGTISLQAELIGSKRDPQHANAVEAILRSARRMNRLIGDLLDASAINAGKLKIELGIHSAAMIVREVLEAFAGVAAGQKIQLVAHVDETASIHCDRDRVIQALSNLVGNALKFTTGGGTITVSVVRAGTKLRFEVRDNGAGIPAEQLPHLFERFWRAHGQRSGAGLGLFIAHGIVAAHGSTIEVDSTEGAGSLFFFSLPVAT